MIRPDFENWMPHYGAGNLLITQFIKLTHYVKAHPQHAAKLLELFEADTDKVKAALTAALPPEPAE